MDYQRKKTLFSAFSNHYSMKGTQNKPKSKFIPTKRFVILKYSGFTEKNGKNVKLEQIKTEPLGQE